MAPVIVASKLTCSLVIRLALSKVAPSKLSMKHPIVPDITDTKIAEKGLEITPKK